MLSVAYVPGQLLLCLIFRNVMQAFNVLDKTIHNKMGYTNYSYWTFVRLIGQEMWFYRNHNLKNYIRRTGPQAVGNITARWSMGRAKENNKCKSYFHLIGVHEILLGAIFLNSIRS